MENSEVLQEFKVLETGSSYITKNAKIFSEKYPGKFIAVWDSKVIAVESGCEVLIEKIRQMNLDVSKVLIEYIPFKGQIILY